VSEDLGKLLARVAEIIGEDRADFDDARVAPDVTVEQVRGLLDGALPESGSDDETVIDEFVAAARQALVASPGPRYFGFVIGGSIPAALAADWLVSGWDNNGGLYACSPVASVAEETAGRWLVELFGLPAETTVGFPTGGMMANFSGLAAARHRVLARAGWDVEARGLQGAPLVRVIVGAERHATIDIALRYLGLGAASVEVVPADAQGRMRAELLPEVLAAGPATPTIVCAQAGNVNTGAFDNFDAVCDAAAGHDAWVHVDGAFGMWAAGAPSLRPLVQGLDRADSWATDGHKWLNVPYDCGVVLVADPGAHRGALSAEASYLVQGGAGAPLDPFELVPEFSRRARGVTVYAAIRALGREGIADLVERCCAHARRFGARLSEVDGVEVLNDIVLNQVLVRFGDDDETTRRVIDAVQRDGTCWMSGTVWHGRAAMRISVSNWSTTSADVDSSVDAIIRCYRSVDSSR
jgi:glutamate/tyrosine decarboxylase-like PLP-dependent enzyme